MALKRKSVSQSPGNETAPLSDVTNIVKKPKLSEDVSARELATFDRDELISRVLTLQRRLAEANHELEEAKATVKSLEKAAVHQDKARTAPGTSAGVSEWSADKIEERVDKVADSCNKGIKRQMKWQPSCKKGTTKWSYTSVVPVPQVLFKLFSLPSDGKAWKQKKISTRAFEDAVGSIEASARYNHLRITGEHVNLKWDAENRSFTLSGTYGI